MQTAAGVGVLALAAVPASAVARHEHVWVTPRVGDVNTTFLYRGRGWRPHARIGFQHGLLCDDFGFCPQPLLLGRTRADGEGHFTVREHPAQGVPDTFVGYSICFGYTRGWEIARCRASTSITVVPGSVSATPAHVERFGDEPLPTYVRLAVEHFKAGQHLKIQIRYPDGHTRVLHGKTRRHGTAVGVAYVHRGGLIRDINVKRSDPDGTYLVRVKDWHGAEADTTYTVTTSTG